jgi:four helix bundle protein
MAIAYKEALETEYWLKLLRDTGYLTEVQADPLLDRVLELLKMLGKIQQTMKAKDAH